MTPEQLAKSIDYTLLKPNVVSEKIRKICSEAQKYNFATVVVQPCYVSLAAKLLEGTPIKVGTVVGFPFGAVTTAVKRFEATDAILRGARELDMVINIGALKLGEPQLVEQDIHGVVHAVRTEELREGIGAVIIKVIIETCYLEDDEKRMACHAAQNAGADFVKTSTGFGSHNATVDDVRLIREAVNPDVGVKASGGIKDFKTAIEMIDAGATRIGTSSGVKIMQGFIKSGKAC